MTDLEDPQLVEVLYAVESDLRHNPFAEDVRTTLETLHGAGLRLAVLSDIHVDVRPAFDSVGMAGLIDTFVLSVEQGITTLLLPSLEDPRQRRLHHVLSLIGLPAGQAA